MHSHQRQPIYVVSCMVLCRLWHDVVTAPWDNLQAPALTNTMCVYFERSMPGLLCVAAICGPLTIGRGGSCANCPIGCMPGDTCTAGVCSGAQFTALLCGSASCVARPHLSVHTNGLLDLRTICMTLCRPAASRPAWQYRGNPSWHWWLLAPRACILCTQSHVFSSVSQQCAFLGSSALAAPAQTAPAAA
jgi:hypothetical protein